MQDMTTTQKMKFFVKDFLSKCDQIHRKLWIWSHLLKKSLMEDFVFCARDDLVNPKTLIYFTSMKESLSIVGKLYLAFNRHFVARYLHRNVLFTMFYLDTDRYKKKKKIRNKLSFKTCTGALFLHTVFIYPHTNDDK